MTISNSISHTNEITKLAFIFNAIEKGWSVKKKGKVYIFSKKHNNDYNYFKPSFIYEFIHSNFSVIR